MAKPAKPKRGKPAKSRGQVQRICNLLPSRETENDWRFENALTAGALAAPPPPPASVDLRAAWWDVGDQGRTGSCVGWASTDGLARYMLVKAGKLAKSEHLSVRFTWMASKETDPETTLPETMLDCAGTYLKSAADILRKFGSVPDGLCPFIIAEEMYTGLEKDFFSTAATRKIASYFNLGRDLNNWKAWLASTGPILAGLNVDSNWYNAKSTGGVLDSYVPPPRPAGHAVCIVGYRADGRFIVRNSWGTTNWGDKGFAYASPAYINAGFFPESYGMTV
jgi:C1A family cysteine protease